VGFVNVEGERPAEPGTVSVFAQRTALRKLWLYEMKQILTKLPYGAFLTPMRMQQITALERYDGQEFLKELEAVVGYDADGRKLPDAPRHQAIMQEVHRQSEDIIEPARQRSWLAGIFLLQWLFYTTELQVFWPIACHCRQV